MTRLILVTFAMLGWTFYVMSDGPDFEPRGVRSAPPVQVAAASAPRPTSAASTRAEQLVTKAALAPAPLPVSTAELAPKPDQAETKALLKQVAFGLNSAPSMFDDQSATFTLASLEEGAAALRQVAPEPSTDQAQNPVSAEPQKDIREISGTRVNMRDGPGTIYPVIGKAAIGQKAEVLSDSGTGWLRLRVLPGQQVGWISASLVRKTSN